MRTEKKFFLEKNDDVDAATDKFAETPAGRIILNIPKNSVLGKTVHNFQILKREAETAGKEILVESVDEHILELASMAGITAVNPIFKTKERAVTDILPRAERPKESAKEEKREERVEEKVVEEIEEVECVPDIEENAKREKGGRKKKSRKLIWIPVSLAALLAAFFIVTYVLPRVAITMTVEKMTSDFSEGVLVSTSAASSSFSGGTITLPGQIISAKSNISLHFAGGVITNVSTRATGTLTVYNDYNSSPQTLVATTRFVSPEGKLFRSTERVIVPGIKTSDGTTTPGSAEVSVVAAVPGSNYNVGPSMGWTIPGFEGTPRYDKFSAAALEPMAGGFMGTTTVPTAGDFATATSETSQKLEDILKSQIALLASANLTSLPQSSTFTITRTLVTGSPSGGGFDVFEEGEMEELAFDESTLQNSVLSAVSNPQGGPYKVDSFEISYSPAVPDFEKGQMSLEATGTIAYEPAIDVNKIKSEIRGMNADTLKATIFSLPGLQNAQVSFWPFWVSKVPTNPANITIEVQ